MINTSPEPVTNWSASLSEDMLVIAGLWTALNHPIFSLILFIIFIGLAIWLLPKLWYLIKGVLRKIGRFFGMAKNASAETGSATVPEPGISKQDK